MKLTNPIVLLFLGLVAVACCHAAFGQDSTYNSKITLLASTARTTTTNSADISNPNWRGAQCFLNITVASGADSVTLSLQAKDPVSGNYVSRLTGLAETTTGEKTYILYPGILPLANAAASDLLPLTWRANVVHSGAGSFTYSASCFLFK